MIAEIHLENYRCFRKHKITFGRLSIIVGENNAGKTTLVEALRLVAAVTQRYRFLPYHPGPDWSDIPKREYGIAPSLRNFGMSFESLFNHYGNPPAVVRAIFDNGCQVKIYLHGPERVHAVITDPRGKILKSKQQANETILPLVGIMPQVAPLAKQEVVLDEDYVRSAIASPLAPLHFRNQLNVLYELFPHFQESVESTWPSIRILSLEGQGKKVETPLALEVRNEDFVAEAACMGHGLQMWLQTMWFLTRERRAACVILDEPDVYMHADVQRRLVRHLRDKWPQTLITTHSVEIMAEVDAENIVVVDRRKDESKQARSLPAVQRVLEHVGSKHNIHLMRLWSTRRFLLLEGDDLCILKRLHDTLFPNSERPIDAIPNMSIGGWGGWRHAVGSSMTLQNSFGETIKTYCILDSDYHTPEQLRDRGTEATKAGVSVHIWTLKELENYLLVPSAIARLINERKPERTPEVTEAKVRNHIETIVAGMEDSIFDAMSTEFLAADKPGGSAAANKRARERLKDAKDAGRLAGIASGKEVLSALSDWAKNSYGVSFSPEAITATLHPNEIADEMRQILTAIEHGRDFDG